MALVNKTALLWSFSVVWGICWSLFIQGTNANHAVKPLLFINFLDEDTTGSDTTFNPSFEENDIKSFSYEEIKFINDDATVFKANSTESTKLSTSTTLNDSENVIDVFKQGTVFGPSVINDENGTDKFETPFNDKTESGMPPEGLNNPESCDYIPLQITRIYFRAISTLIQHIMDAIFNVNEPPMNSKFGEVPTYEDDHLDSSPSRKLMKRDILKVSESGNLKTQPESNVKSTTHLDIVKEITHTNDSSEGQTSTQGSNLVRTKLPSQQNKTVINSSKPSTETELPHIELNSTVEINVKNVTDDIKHDTTLKNGNKETKLQSSTSATHSSHASTSLKQPSSPRADIPLQSSSTQADILFDEKKDAKNNSQNDMVSNEDLIKDKPVLLYEQTYGSSKEKYGRHVFEIDRSEIQSKVVERPNEEKQEQNTSSSSAGIIFTMTGIVLVVIVVAFVGAAAAYTYVWKNKNHSHQGQHLGPGPSSQRSTLA